MSNTFLKAMFNNARIILRVTTKLYSVEPNVSAQFFHCSSTGRGDSKECEIGECSAAKYSYSISDDIVRMRVKVREAETDQQADRGNLHFH